MAKNQEVKFWKIKNIRNKEGENALISLEFQQRNEAGEWDSYTMECKEEAKPGFYKALADLAPAVPALCELPEGLAKRIRVNGVSLSYVGEAEVLGAKILATLALEKGSGAVSLNTPFRLESPISKKEGEDEGEGIEDVSANVLPKEVLKAIKKLISEAADYRAGERLQGRLPLKDGKSAAAGEDK